MKVLAVHPRQRIEVRSCNPTFPGAWRGAGSSGCFNQPRVCGSTNERVKTAQRTTSTASESPSPHLSSHNGGPGRPSTGHFPSRGLPPD